MEVFFFFFFCLCRMLTSFLVGLFNLYEDLFFTYLEINPLGKSQKQPTPPQLSARLLIQFFPMSWHCWFALWRPKTNHFQFFFEAVKFLLAHYVLMTKNKSYVKNILRLFSFITKGRTLIQLGVKKKKKT